MADELRVYNMYGLRVASALPLDAEAQAAGPVDVTVLLGDQRAATRNAPAGELVAHQLRNGEPRYTIALTDAGYVIRFHGVCDMEVSADLTTVVCHLDTDADPRLASVLFLGTTMAFLLTKAGHLTLHGSAVFAENATIGFIGTSGIGKSTVAALCCTAGASLITDDVVLLYIGPEAVSCLGGWPELRVRPQSTTALRPLLPDRFTARTTVDGRTAFAEPASVPMPQPLRALVVPRPAHHRTDVSLEVLSPHEAALVLLATDRIENWRRPDDRRRQFEGATEVARRVPVLVADIGWHATTDTGRTLLTAITDELTRDGDPAGAHV